MKNRARAQHYKRELRSADVASSLPGIYCMQSLCESGLAAGADKSERSVVLRLSSNTSARDKHGA